MSNASLASLAIQRGFITPLQVKRALEEQNRRGGVPLGPLLVEMNLITPEQLASLQVEAPRIGLTRLGGRAVEAGWITRDQLEAALHLQQGERRRPPHRIGEILVDEGRLDAARLRDLLRKQGLELLACTGCGHRFNAREWSAERNYPCPRCRTRLVQAPDGPRIDADGTLAPLEPAGKGGWQSLRESGSDGPVAYEPRVPLRRLQLRPIPIACGVGAAAALLLALTLTRTRVPEPLPMAPLPPAAAPKKPSGFQDAMAAARSKVAVLPVDQTEARLVLADGLHAMAQTVDQVKEAREFRTRLEEAAEKESERRFESARSMAAEAGSPQKAVEAWAAFRPVHDLTGLWYARVHQEILKLETAPPPPARPPPVPKPPPVVRRPVEPELPADLPGVVALERLDRPGSVDVPLDDLDRIRPRFADAVGFDPALREEAQAAIAWHAKTYAKRMEEIATENGVDTGDAAMALAYAGVAKVSGKLSGILKSSEPIRRANAVEGWSRLDRAPWQDLLRSLDDAEPIVRLAAARALSRPKDGALKKQLEKWAADIKKKEGMGKAVLASYALALQGRDDFLPFLQATLGSEGPEGLLAYAAMEHLDHARKGLPSAASALKLTAERHMRTTDSGVRAPAFRRVARSGVWSLEEFLAHLGSADPFLRSAALQFLKTPPPEYSLVSLVPKLIEAVAAGKGADLPSPRAPERSMTDETEVVLRALLGAPAEKPSRTERLAEYRAAYERKLDGLIASDVNRAIEKGVRYLRRVQQEDGAWPVSAEGGRSSYHAVGSTALSVYALLESGVDVEDDGIQRGLKYLAAHAAQTGVYDTSCVCMALAEAVKKLKEKGRPHEELLLLLKRAARALTNSQNGHGAWSYPALWGETQVAGGTTTRQAYDNSNTQFAILGLGAATTAGVYVPEPVWERILAHLRADHLPDGGWGYMTQKTGGREFRGSSYESMTSAGVGGAIIALQALKAKTTVEEVREDTDVAKGLEWLSGHYRLMAGRVRLQRGNPGWGFYYDVYSLERAMMLAGIKTLGGRHDWYRDISQQLIVRQQASGGWESVVDSDFALLFLKRSYVTTR